MALEEEIDSILEPALNEETLKGLDIKPFEPYNVDRTEVQVKKASLSNLSSSDGLVYDSELTFRGTIRKKKFKVGRVFKKRGKYNSKKNRIKNDLLKNSQISLLTYAPMYTNIYTLVTGLNRYNKYLYIDVYSVHDNRLYKISKLVATILGYKIFSPTAQCVADDVIRVPYGLDYETNKIKVQLNIEEKLIKDLSEKMFGVNYGYFWQSTRKLIAVDIPKPVVEKSFKAEVVVDKTPNTDKIDTQEVKKNYRIR